MSLTPANYTLIGRIAIQAYLTNRLYNELTDEDIGLDDLIAVGEFGLGTAFLWTPGLESNLLGRALIRSWPVAAGYGLGVAVGLPIAHHIDGEEGVDNFVDVVTGQVLPWDSEYDDAIQEGFGGWSNVPGAIWDEAVEFAQDEIISPLGDLASSGWDKAGDFYSDVRDKSLRAAMNVEAIATAGAVYGVRKGRRAISILEDLAWKPWYIA